MPWKETCTMDERLKFIAEHLKNEQTISELCRRYGISRPTGYKWIERYDSFGLEGLDERTSAPQRHPNQTPTVIEDKLVEFRGKHKKWGPHKLLHRLKKKEPQIPWPALSTVGAILKRRGLVVPRRLHRKVSEYSGPWHAGASPNDVWAADFKGWFKTRDGLRIDPLTISDWSSRYLLCCQGLKHPRGLPVKQQFERIFREYGLPLVIRTDNGVPFASTGLGGLSRLSVWWIRLGIRPERIRPGHPEENGRHERMHKTLKEATAKPACKNLAEQQIAFDNFRQEFNEQRPHEALDMQTPSEKYQASPRPFPERLLALEYSSEFQVRRVRSKGQIKWQGNLLFISEALIGQQVALKNIDNDIWSVHFGPLKLAEYNSAAQSLTRT